ncbi:MAG: TIGR03986 family CRISPR-associated RAMP protein [Oscillospiraceae bacterium]|nr:TIGR03986 family CRISPR-associated RAMP protein [Oscillospiraceae bacterium]
MDGFINPYTFIPVGQGVKKEYAEYFTSSLLSGKICCTLTSRTQLAVCDKVSERDFDFFKIDGKAVIMGSSLRGTIRSIYEALTDSCLSSTNAEDEDYFSSRLNKESAGLIEHTENGYILHTARRFKDENNTQLGSYRTGDYVGFTYYSKKGRAGTIQYFQLDNSSPKKGYVHKTDRFRSKMAGKPIENKDSIFEKTDQSVKLTEKSIRLLEENIFNTIKNELRYQTKNKQIAKDYLSQFRKMQKGGTLLPVWYYKKGQNYYLAPSQMSRTIFYRQPVDFLKDINLNPCNTADTICESCALFGIVRKSDDSGSFAKASRIRFSDAVCENPDCFDKKFTLPILASPRLSSFEFYLKSKDEQYCADDKGVTIAGRKYYWHHNDDPRKIKSDAKNKEGNNMDARVQLVKPDSEFHFEVYFDQIPEDALKKLLFALTLGENTPDSRYCHKVGHGKPIGLGSAKITVDAVTVRTFSDGIYQETPYEWTPEQLRKVFANQQNVDNILKVTNFDAVDGKDIQYPSLNPTGGDIFKWFAQNRDGLRSIGQPMKYYYKLPSLNDEDQHLPYYPNKRKAGGYSSGNGGGYGKGKKKR